MSDVTTVSTGRTVTGADATGSSSRCWFPRQVLIITCAGVVLASLDLFIVNVALPQIAHDLEDTEPGRTLLGAQRLRHRLRVAAGLLRSPRRPLPPRPCLSPRRCDLHRGVRRLCRLHQCRHAHRLPPRTGRWGGLAHADLARLGPRLLPGRAQARCRSRLDGRRRHVRRRGPGCRRPAGRSELAVGLSGQRAGRNRRARHRLAPTPPCAGPSGANDPIPSGWYWPPPGWPPSPSGSSRAATGAGAHPESSRHSAALCSAHNPLRARLPQEPHPAHTPIAVSFRAGLHRRIAGGPVLLRLLRGDAAVDRALGAGRLGVVGAALRAGHRARSYHGPLHVVRRGRQAASSPATGRPG